MKTLNVEPDLRMEGTWFGRDFAVIVQMNSLCTVEIEWPLVGEPVIKEVCDPYDPRDSVHLAGDRAARTVITLPEMTVGGAEARLRAIFGEHVPDLTSIWMYKSQDGEHGVEIGDWGPERRKIVINVYTADDDPELLANYLAVLTESELVIAAMYANELIEVLLEPAACNNRLLTYGKLIALLPYPTEDGCE